MKKNLLIFPIIVVVLAIIAVFSFHGSSSDEPPQAQPLVQTEALASASLSTADIKTAELPAAEPFRSEDLNIKTGSTFYKTLASSGIALNTIAHLVETAKPVANLANLAARTLVKIVWHSESDTEPHRVEVKLDEQKSLILANGDEGWQAQIQEAKIAIEPVSYSGLVTNNLWNSALSAGMDPNNIMKLSEIFAWQIDFNRQVQIHDRWRLTVEQIFADGEPIGFGEVISAEYENAGVVFTAVRFKPEDGPTQYFAPDGTSLKRMFLKSPLKYGRITSGFSHGRFHPILKISRPHRGVDYGAPTGTPIMAVGHGVVEQSGYRGASGNMISLRHNGTYKTQYKHLSRFASNIRAGSRVEMGQVIGYVGSTGLSTGPHLHFEFHVSGNVVDPQGMKFPTADPVPPEQRQEFFITAKSALDSLPPWSETPSSGPAGVGTLTE